MAHLSIGVKFTAGSSELVRRAAHIRIHSNRLYDEIDGKWAPSRLFD